MNSPESVRPAFSFPNLEESAFSNLPVYELPPRAVGFNGGVAYEIGEKPKLIECQDYQSYLELEKNFPKNIVLDMRTQLAYLKQDKCFGHHTGYYLIKAAVDACLFSLPDSLDMLEAMHCHIEAAVDSYVEDATAGGWLPPSDDDSLEFTNNLVSVLIDFSVRVVGALINNNLPIVQTIGVPYELEGISPSGLILLVKQDAFRHASMFDI